MVDLLLLCAVFSMFGMASAFANRSDRARLRAGEQGRWGEAHQLSPYELAYLAGGPRRVINTALSMLVTVGAVRVSRGSQITAVRGAPSSAPIEQAVLDVLTASQVGYWTASQLRRTLETHAAIASLVHELEARGLMASEQALGAAWRWLGWLRFAVAAEAGLLILLLILDWADMAGETGTYTWTLLASVSAVGLGINGVRQRRRRLAKRVTAEGLRIVRAASAYHPQGGARDRTSVATAVGMPVALYGLTELDDQALRIELSAGDNPGGD
ncbi:TIGR04222 domain-containing membrane protein [Nonomuraea sp. H19]|uniref:TIGR04222 domain-containing membrane protein n=1 Tax=Nonomuraea sp. H19 TaxID=3452206 RepID=UPI003F8AC680